MAQEPSLDVFRRWLQREIEKAEDDNERDHSEQRLVELEAALILAISFDREFSQRAEAGVQPTKQVPTVRLIQRAPEPGTPKDAQKPMDVNACQSCEEPMEADLDFCAKCGATRQK